MTFLFPTISHKCAMSVVAITGHQPLPNYGWLKVGAAISGLNIRGIILNNGLAIFAHFVALKLQFSIKKNNI